MQNQQRQASYGVLGEVGSTVLAIAKRYHASRTNLCRFYPMPDCTGLDQSPRYKPIQTIFYAVGDDMKTEIEFIADKDIIRFTLRGENGSEVALLRILKSKQPKIEWNHAAGGC